MSTTIMHNVHVVIRSANERTEALCLHLVEKQVSSHSITVIRERPFHAALKRAFEIGLEANRRWTLCIDADVLIRDGAIRDLIAFGESTAGESLGCSGFIFDKLRGGTHSGGLHSYRTQYLSEMLSLLREAPIISRPETYLKNTMRAKGHEWILTHQVFGLHDFKQYYRDIFRKMAVRAHKSSNELDNLFARASQLASMDNDFLVALWGLRLGKTLTQTPSIDAENWRQEIDLLLTAHDLIEKKHLALEGGEQFVSRLMAEEAASVGVLDNHAFILSHESKKNFLKTMKIRNWIWYAGWMLNRFGVKIQKSALN